MPRATAPIATGGFVLRPPGAYVYRLYASDDELLYIGVTGSIPTRMVQHRRSSPWFAYAYRIEWEEWPDRYDALVAESLQIGELHPRHNVAMNHEADHA